MENMCQEIVPLCLATILLSIVASDLHLDPDSGSHKFMVDGGQRNADLVPVSARSSLHTWSPRVKMCRQQLKVMGHTHPSWPLAICT